MVKQVGASSKVKKVHYPSSKFEVDKVQVRSKGNGLREVLKEICSKEEESLKPIFSLEGVSAKDALNKKNIHDALLEMMSRLNDSVAQDLDEEQETYFKPELSKEEREQIELKQNKLESLQKQLDKLNHYSENLNDFREAAGLWLGTAPAVKPNSGSEHVESTAKRYTNILESIESSCNQILQLSDSCNIEMQSSRQIQERLYDEYNSLRLAVAADPQAGVPRDTKDVLRSLPKLYK